MSLLQQVQQVRLAVAIGNDNYKNLARLNSAGKDAQAMAQRLQQMNFEILQRDAAGELGWAASLEAAHVANASRRDFSQIVRTLRARIEETPSYYQLITFWYFNGYGFVVDGRPYMVPVTPAQGGPDLTCSQELTMAMVNKAAKCVMDLSILLSNSAQRNLHSIFVLDSCHVHVNVSAGGTGQSTRLRSASAEQRHDSACVLFAHRRGAHAADTSMDGQSAFTARLLEELKPGRTIRQVYDHVASQLGPEQRPQLLEEMEQLGGSELRF